MEIKFQHRITDGKRELNEYAAFSEMSELSTRCISLVKATLVLAAVVHAMQHALLTASLGS